MSAVQDRLALDEADVRDLLGLSPTDPSAAVLTMYLTVAKRAADDYLNNPFLQRTVADASMSQASDPVVYGGGAQAYEQASTSKRIPFPYELDANGDKIELAIPEPVKMGVLDYVRYLIERANRRLDVTAEGVGDLSRTYKADTAALDAAVEMWRPYRLMVGG